jgi:translocator protein
MLLLFLALPLLVGTLGAVLGPDAWYAALAKPSWSPPSWVFAPVWTTLYLMMGVAAWLVWRTQGGGTALVLWGVQLALNAAWTPLFFGLHRPDLAFAEIVTLWLFLLATVVACWRASATAGLLLIPYLAWVSFAAALNLAIWRLNS